MRTTLKNRNTLALLSGLMWVENVAKATVVYPRERVYEVLSYFLEDLRGSCSALQHTNTTVRAGGGGIPTFPTTGLEHLVRAAPYLADEQTLSDFLARQRSSYYSSRCGLIWPQR